MVVPSFSFGVISFTYVFRCFGWRDLWGEGGGGGREEEGEEKKGEDCSENRKD